MDVVGLAITPGLIVVFNPVGGDQLYDNAGSVKVAPANKFADVPWHIVVDKGATSVGLVCTVIVSILLQAPLVSVTE